MTYLTRAQRRQLMPKIKGYRLTRNPGVTATEHVMGRDISARVERATKRREARDKIRKAIAAKEGVSWMRVILTGPQGSKEYSIKHR